MAKGLRSNSKIAARNKKRYSASSDYAVTSAARLNLVAARLRARAERPAAPRADGADDADAEWQDADRDEAQADTPMDAADASVDAPQKISTSHPRGSRNEQWRKRKGAPLHGGSKNKGRTKRRR
ncbi:hypothetical protein MSPP1_002512 [Malassezia sp. CBS 17886]|nr:hypothetical protein MSPP1_002512 [Malassezia sp. CBS 17886]